MCIEINKANGRVRDSVNWREKTKKTMSDEQSSGVEKESERESEKEDARARSELKPITGAVNIASQ